MAEAYDWEIRERAEELFVIDGRTYDEVAGLTGVSASQLKRWGKAGWTKSRREYRSALGDIKRKTVLLRRDLLEKAINSKDPQNVYAFAALERTVKPKEMGKKDEPVPLSDRTFENPSEAISALEDAIQRKVNLMISVSGELNYDGISDMQKAMKILDQMKTRYSESKKGSGGISKQRMMEIKEEFKL